MRVLFEKKTLLIEKESTFSSFFIIPLFDGEINRTKAVRICRLTKTFSFCSDKCDKMQKF
ncbi:MAG TPA: hypothetical protein DCG79_00040 [Clostridiales bacterium]|nr:hypothetical protein [Clostridiales bacterium]